MQIVAGHSSLIKIMKMIMAEMLLEMVIEVLVMLLKFVMSLVIKMMRAMTMVLKQDLCRVLPASPVLSNPRWASTQPSVIALQ